MSKLGKSDPVRTIEFQEVFKLLVNTFVGSGFMLKVQFVW